MKENLNREIIQRKKESGYLQRASEQREPEEGEGRGRENLEVQRYY